MDDGPTGPHGPAPWSDWVVGTRMVVRYRIARDRPGGPGHTDALGEIVALDPASVTVRTRSGDVTIPTAAIAVGKPVPPPPPRHRAHPPPADGGPSTGD